MSIFVSFVQQTVVSENLEKIEKVQEGQKRPKMSPKTSQASHAILNTISQMVSVRADTCRPTCTCS